MTIRDMEYKTLSESQDLADLLDNSANLQKIFVNCTFADGRVHNYVNCRFECCVFDSVNESQFINCSFVECRFCFNFHGKMSNCNVQKHNGYLIEGSML